MKFKFLICALLFGFLFFDLCPLSARELEREAKVIFVQGGANVRKAGKTEWTGAREGMLLTDGDAARTDKDSAIELSFDKENKNVVRLEENSSATLRGKMLKQIELPQGRIRSLVKSLKKETSFEIKTPTIVAGARGSGWDVSTSEKRDNVKAFEDEIFVRSYDADGKQINEIFVREGWEVTIDRFQAPGELSELTVKDKNDWSSWREDLNERLQTGGADEDNRADAFGNVETIRQVIEKQEDFKSRISETEDIKKVEERIKQDNVQATGGSSGGRGNE